MSIVITTAGDDVIVVAPAGEINGQTAPELQNKLLPLVRPGGKVLLDMSGVTYLSSAGLRLLLVFYRQVTGNNGRIVLTGLPEMVADTMSNTGFLDFFEAYALKEEGLAVLRQ